MTLRGDSHRVDLPLWPGDLISVCTIEPLFSRAVTVLCISSPPDAWIYIQTSMYYFGSLKAVTPLLASDGATKL